MIFDIHLNNSNSINLDDHFLLMIIKIMSICVSQINSNILVYINPWSPKVRIQGVSTKVGSKLPHKKNQYFLEKLTKLDKFFRLEISDDFTIYHDF